jgi:ATP-dependent Clp protease ATP-binding subunit ClpC
VVILTSNVGSLFVAAGAADNRDAAGYERMKLQVTEALRQTFRPEFLNRIDEIIVFHSLTDKDLDRIVDLLLADLQRRLADRDLVLELTPAARAVIARDGYDPQFGARPLKRSLQRLVENPLARALLEGRFGPGAHIRLDADPVNGTLVFTGSGGESVVTDANDRRDARSASQQPALVGGSSIFDLPDAPDGGGPDRLN